MLKRDVKLELTNYLRLTNKLDVSGRSGTNIDPLPLLCSLFVLAKFLLQVIVTVRDLFFHIADGIGEPS